MFHAFSGSSSALVLLWAFCLAVWALGDGLGWAFEAGSVFWPSFLGVEDLAII